MIIIPMMGRSSRFQAAGYNVPKYRLPLAGKSLFEQSVLSFQDYFADESIVFVFPDDQELAGFISGAIDRLDIASPQLVMLGHPTRGQAHTVERALAALDLGRVRGSGVYIFNIDTILLRFRRYDFGADVAGALDVFPAEGSHWSFVVPSPQGGGRVSATTEKVRVSDLCSNGLYYFRDPDEFMQAYRGASRYWAESGEEYIAPMYNVLIDLERDVRYRDVPAEDVVLCGTPEEYQELLSAPEILHRLARR